MTGSTTTVDPELVQALLRNVKPSPGCAAPQLVETHISWVLLTGDYAYKVKKPVRLPFVDFSSLERRRAACEEELRLNRLLAPQLYLEVVPVTGDPGHPRIGGSGKALDYAVKMRQFPSAHQLDRLLDAGALEAADLERFGGTLARLHQSAASAPADSRFGTPQQVQAPFVETVRDLRSGAPADCQSDLERIEAWLVGSNVELKPLLEERKRRGRIRECHGDLHLANLVMLDQGVVPFDRIEFSEDLRWIDVISDVAFLVMDLDQRGRADLAYAFLNAYLEAAGDYEGLRLLRYYLVYRALVRAKIAMIRWCGATAAQSAGHAQQCRAYVRWAARRIEAAHPGLVLMHGLSGSGKTRVSGELAQGLPAVRVRSDLERKRLHGMAPLQRGSAAPGAGIYGAASSRQVYSVLAQAAETAIESGETIVVDAAFLDAAERSRFLALARRLGASCAIVECVAPVAELERRVAQRAAAAQDASDAGLDVLHAQLARHDPLNESERSRTLTVDSASTALAERLRPLLHR